MNLAIQVNDIHLKESNLTYANQVFCEAVDKCVELGVELWIAGDVFESRTSQRLSVLLAFQNMLLYAESKGIHVRMIAGNHDKTRYDAEESFLDPYGAFHGVTLYKTPTLERNVLKSPLNVLFVPYFTEKQLVEMLDIEVPENTILVSHFAVTGSVNNDGTEVDSQINGKLLKKFKAVYLGHYHDFQQPIKGVYHCPSMMQHNFGENTNKGGTLIKSDGSWERVPLGHMQYETVHVDASELKGAFANDLIQKYKDVSHNVKLKVSGDKEALAAIKVEPFENVGIKVEKVREKLDTVDTSKAPELLIYNESTVEESFKAYCDKKGRNYDEGYELLKEGIECQKN